MMYVDMRHGIRSSVLFVIEVFHEVAGFVEFLVVGALDLSIALGRDHGVFPAQAQASTICRSALKALSASKISLRQSFQIVGLPHC
jgi:hypothetical protein